MLIIWGHRTKAGGEKRRYWRTCPNCGNLGFLKSYDATRHFTLYGIPASTTGKYRILDYCSQCTKGVQRRRSHFGNGL